MVHKRKSVCLEKPGKVSYKGAQSVHPLCTLCAHSVHTLCMLSARSDLYDYLQEICFESSIKKYFEKIRCSTTL